MFYRFMFSKLNLDNNFIQRDFLITVPHFQKIASQNGSWAVLKLESSEKMTREHCRVFQWRKFFLIHVQVTLQVKEETVQNKPMQLTIQLLGIQLVDIIDH